MITRFLPLALLLAACSPSPSENTQAPIASAGPEAPSADTDAPAGADGDDHAKPQPGEQKTFKDWTVACDNSRRCTMASLGPDGGDFPAASLAVTRAPGPEGGFEIAVDQLQDAPPRPSALVLDGQRFDVGTTVSGAGAGEIAGKLANGTRLTVQGNDGQTIATISLAGAAASLRYIDAAQGRAGTVTAAVAKGPAAAETVPAAPAVPVIVQAATLTETKADAALVGRLKKQEDCTEIAADMDASAYAIGGGRTLLLVPCDAGAYNVMANAYVVAADGTATPAVIDAPTGLNPDQPEAGGVGTLVNATLDGGALMTLSKGRGLGDCGISQRFVWDGATLRLSEQSEMGECRGNPNYLTTWRTRVVTR